MPFKIIDEDKKNSVNRKSLTKELNSGYNIKARKKEVEALEVVIELTDMAIEKYERIINHKAEMEQSIFEDIRMMLVNDRPYHEIRNTFASEIEKLPKSYYKRMIADLQTYKNNTEKRLATIQKFLNKQGGQKNVINN